MSSHKRRQYPQQQIAAYDTGVVQPQLDDAGAPGVFVPASQAQAQAAAMSANQLGDQLDQLHVGAAGAYASPMGAPMGAPTPSISQVDQNYQYSSPYGSAPPPGSARMNELVSVDLLTLIPPPVNNLDLPPPAIGTPIEQTVCRSEYAQASSDYMRSTLNVVPASGSLLKKSKLPLSLVVRPFMALHDADESIPLVSDMCIARCRRCRAYINPFVRFAAGDNRWGCNICGAQNEVPPNFDWDRVSQTTLDRWSRSELNYGIVDYVANNDYVTRSPQPPTYTFLLDASVGATSSGILHAVSETILASIDDILSVNARARVAFILVDGALNFFMIPPPQLASENEPAVISEPKMLVVTDLDDPFLPTNDRLVVELNENRAAIEKFLTTLPEYFANTCASSNAMGSGLKAALKLMNNSGGKIICVNTALPTVGLGKLQPRDDPKLVGTKNEHQIYAPAGTFYKSFAVDCNKAQVTVDLFLAGNSYQDVATLSNLPKFTGGSTFYYPGWNAEKAIGTEKLRHELRVHLSQEIGMEGMYRARCSSGMRAVSFSGHFFVRSSDLMTFPTLTRHHAYLIELQIDEPLKKPYVVIQGAFLYTTYNGERRIRVMTQQLPVSTELADVYASADEQAIATYYAHTAADKVVANGIDGAKDYINAQVAEILKTYRSDVLNAHTGTSSALSISSNLCLLPVILYALKKCVGLRKQQQIRPDLRVHILDLLQTLPVPSLMKFLYPDMYPLHELPEEAGLPDEFGEIVLPQRLNLTGAMLATYGLYMIDNGQVIFIWVGVDVVRELLLDAFGVESIEQVPSGKCEMPVVEQSELNLRIRNLINASRTRNDTVYYPNLYIVHDRSEPMLKLWISSQLIEDRSENEISYHQYLKTIYENLNR